MARVSWLGSLLALGTVAAVAAPVMALPVKAEASWRSRLSAHAKAAALPHGEDEPIRGAALLPVGEVPDSLSFLPVLPGERVPLRALGAGRRPVAASWVARGGRLAFGERIAVWQAPFEAGVHQVMGTSYLGGRAHQRVLNMVVTVPVGKVVNGQLNGYPIGNYPRGLGSAGSAVASRGLPRDGYGVPAGFIELTPQNLGTAVSQHFKLGDFAGKDAWVGGKKYLFLEPKLVEKLERVIVTVNGLGGRCQGLELLSAYRSPALNSRIGNETTLSRHTYGDAADIICADYTGDGVNDRKDAELLMAAITKLDRETHLVGGASIYRPGSGHGYFVHTDTRGALVRW